MEDKRYDLAEVITWIVLNREDTDAMDEINGVTFPFTSKYKAWVKKNSSKE